MRWIDQWRHKRRLKQYYDRVVQERREDRQVKKSQKFCEDFYEQGIKMKAFRHMKLFAQVAGNKMARHRQQERIGIEIDAKVFEKKAHLEFLENMVKELEEKYRIELRKKAILKN